MALLDILVYPDPRLRNKALPVEVVDATLRKLVEVFGFVRTCLDVFGYARPPLDALRCVWMIREFSLNLKILVRKS